MIYFIMGSSSYARRRNGTPPSLTQDNRPFVTLFRGEQEHVLLVNVKEWGEGFKLEKKGDCSNPGGCLGGTRILTSPT